VAGLTIDPSNNIYVVDGMHNMIQKFASDGTFVGQWGSYGNGPGQFNNPMGIAIDPSGNYVYVADYYNARINVFAYAPLAPIIYQSPTNQVVPAGSTLAQSSGVFGAQPLVYQWQSNGTNIPNATNAALVISNVTLDKSGTYLLIASNSLGVAVSSNASISVLPVVVTTLPVSGISATGAVLNGSAVLGSNPSAAWFEWGTNTTYGNIAGLTNLPANTNVALSQPLTNLSGAVMYHYRLAGSNSLGVAYGQDVAFQVGLKPVVVTLPVQPAGPGSVLLNAAINPEARDTSAYLHWGVVTNPNAHNTPTNQIGSGIVPVSVQNQISGLSSSLIYSVQAVASNELGIVSGNTVNFIAPPWVLLPVPPQHYWKSIAASADGSRLAAVGGDESIFLSTNSGMSWTTNVFLGQTWWAITMSADGSRLVAISGGGPSGQTGPAYFSINYGSTWTRAATPDHNWLAIAASAEGLKVAGVDSAGRRILTSTNGGLNWATNSPPVSARWSTIASSADGDKLIVAAGGVDTDTNGPLYLSTNAGLSWSSNNLPSQYWRSVASSADGQILVAAVGGVHAGPIYISTNAGTSWSVTSAPVTNWQSVALSANGTKIAAVVHVEGGPIYTSADSGLTWQTSILPQSIRWAIVSSADGAKLIVSGDQNLFSLQTTPAPQLETRRLAGPQLSLSWIIPSAPFRLQQTPDLSVPQWTTLTNAPALIFTNVHYQVVAPVTGASGFYRLSEQ
jgi:hypothetical protein